MPPRHCEEAKPTTQSSLRYTDRNRWQSQGRWIASLALAMTRRCERRSEIASFTIERDCSRRHETASASSQGADDPVPFSVSRKERMERREAPECLRGTLWRILARDSPASLTRADCESVSRDARVLMREGLRGLPPERCASRRSICQPEMTGWRWIIPPRHERGRDGCNRNIVKSCMESITASSPRRRGPIIRGLSEDVRLIASTLVLAF